MERHFHRLMIRQTMAAEPDRVFEQLRSGRWLELTGADRLEMQFRVGGAYRLTFEGRGVVWGRFLRIVSNQQVALSWNVEGFRPVPDVDSIVRLRLQEQDGQSVVTLTHERITQADSAHAKHRAWTEILQTLQAELER